MNEKQGGGSPNRWLLLLIPASMLMMAKARRHRKMWEHGWDPTGHGFGHHGPVGGSGADGDTGGEFRLPPRIESILGSWHARAHQEADATEPPKA